MCASEGARVVITDIDDERGNEVAAELGATYLHLDVRDDDGWCAVAAQVEAEYGRIDGLVNNAGVFSAETLLDGDVETTRRIIEINQMGPYLGMKRIAPAMIEGGGGSIVNIASIGGMRGYPAFAYASTKWALRGMTKSAARELAPHNIRVNAVNPGLVDTAMIEGTPPDRLRELEASTPLGRLGDPTDIAGPVVFLLSNESSFMTGAEMVVDGGIVA